MNILGLVLSGVALIAPTFRKEIREWWRNYRAFREFVRGLDGEEDDWC